MIHSFSDDLNFRGKKLPFGQNTWHRHQKGSFLKGPYKPTCRDCVMVFSITVNVQGLLVAKSSGRPISLAVAVRSPGDLP